MTAYYGHRDPGDNRVEATSLTTSYTSHLRHKNVGSRRSAVSGISVGGAGCRQLLLSRHGLHHGRYQRGNCDGVRDHREQQDIRRSTNAVLNVAARHCRSDRD